MKKRQLFRYFLQKICFEKNLLMTVQHEKSATQNKQHENSAILKQRSMEIAKH